MLSWQGGQALIPFLPLVAVIFVGTLGGWLRQTAGGRGGARTSAEGASNDFLARILSCRKHEHACPMLLIPRCRSKSAEREQPILVLHAVIVKRLDSALTSSKFLVSV